MKTNMPIILRALAVVIAANGTLLASDPAQSPASDKPVTKTLFYHTSDKPYDIVQLAWCNGMASRIQVVPKTQRTIIIAYNAGRTPDVKICGRNASLIGFRVCKNGQTATLFDVITVKKPGTILPELATRLSSEDEWRGALAMQSVGALDVKTFARTQPAGAEGVQFARAHQH